MKTSNHAIVNVIKYLNEKTVDGEVTTKELMIFFNDNNFLSDSLFYLKLDNRGSRLKSILKQSKLFDWENKYSRKYQCKLLHWRLKK